MTLQWVFIKDSFRTLATRRRYAISFYAVAATMLAVVASFLEDRGVSYKVLLIGAAIFIFPLNWVFYILINAFQQKGRVRAGVDVGLLPFNSSTVPHFDLVRMRKLYRMVVLGSVISAFFMLYIYEHFRYIDLSFQLEDLKAKQAEAASLNSALKLEIAALRNPMRIDVIARRQLGMVKPGDILIFVSDKTPIEAVLTSPIKRLSRDELQAARAGDFVFVMPDKPAPP